MGNGLRNLLAQVLDRRKLLQRRFAALLRDSHNGVSSIITVLILCLVSISAPQADESNEIIESDFTSESDSNDEKPRESLFNLPATAPSLDELPEALFGDRPPEV